MSSDTFVSKAIRAFLIISLCFIFFFLLPSEVVLRFMPRLIPLALVEVMDPSLQEKIEAEIFAESRKKFQYHTSDDGIEFHKYTPNVTLGAQLAQEDIDLGAVDSIQVDGLGFCNDEGRFEKLAQGEPADVLVLGDSYVYCTAVGTKNHWTTLLQDVSGKSVYNIGVQGFGPQQALALYEFLGDKVPAKNVMMLLYGGNDFSDYISYSRKMAAKASGSADEEAKKDAYANASFLGRLMAKTMHSWLFRNSYALSTSLAVVHRLKVILAGTSVVDHVDDRSWVFTNNDGTKTTFNAASHVFTNHSPLSLEWQEKGFPAAEFDALFLKLKAAVEARGATLTMIYVPAVYKVHGDRAAFGNGEIGQAMLASTKTQRAYLKDFTARNGIAYYDATDDLIQVSKVQNTLLYFPVNIHLTPFGNKVLADLLKEHYIPLLDR